MPKVFNTEICIIGAGPAGISAAICLAKNNIPVNLIEKNSISHDKICGGGISGKALQLLYNLDNKIIDEILLQPETKISNGIKIFSPNKKVLSVPFPKEIGANSLPPGITCKRIDFDNVLINAIDKYPCINFFRGTNISKLEQGSDSMELSSEDEKYFFKTKLVIFASGANSWLSNKLTNFNKNIKNTGIGLRGYFEGVEFPNDKGFIELHFLKELLPGYLWIFPLNNNLANVGIYQILKQIHGKKINLKKLLFELIDRNKSLSLRFKNASICNNIQSFNSPLSIGKRKISGSNFLVCGDAASLVNSFSGEGIGNAIESGIIVGLQAINSIKNNDFSDSFLREYDNKIYRNFEKDFKLNNRALKHAKNASLLNFIINSSNYNKILFNKISNLLIDYNTNRNIDKKKFSLNALTKIR